MSLIYSQVATVTVAAGTNTLTVSGMDLTSIIPGMVINIGSRGRVKGDGYIISSVTPSGSTGGTLRTLENVDAAFSNAAFVIDTRDYNGSAPNYLIATYSQVLNTLMKLTSPLTTLFGGSRILALDKDNSSAVSRMMYAIAGRLWGSLEQRTVNGAETLALRSYPDGTTPIDSILIDLTTGGVDTVSAQRLVEAAPTADIGSVYAPIIVVNGAARIVSFGAAKNKIRYGIFNFGPGILVHSASLSLPGGSNINYAAGDRFIANSNSAGNWTVLAYQRADGGPVKSVSKENMYIDGATGTDRVLFWKTADILRWSAYANNSPETGFSNGSNFAIARYDDTGAFIDAPLTISRSTGVVTFNKRPTFDAGPAFTAILTADQSVSNGANLLSLSSTYNRGNAFNNINKRFTAPVAGMYHFDLACVIFGGTPNVGNPGIAIRVNGFDQVAVYNSKDAAYNALHSGVALFLGVGDYVEAIVNLDAMQGTPVAQASRTNFSGFLVG